MALLFSQNKVVLPAISTLFSDHRKCFDMTYIESGCMISTNHHQSLKQPSAEQ